ncbi:BCCT family transporter [Ligilactobacillus sp.]|uniref:BCCT family transporter n=1 Tax=Ligilactobacillus sp. TaxID=2767921 RepID=UPI002FE16C3B
MKGRIDWVITLVPFTAVFLLCMTFSAWPSESNAVLLKIRHMLGDTFGVWYLAVGLFFFLASLYIAFSRYGEIVLGDEGEKPKYGFTAWGTMMFTCGLAADILFYSFSEWISYACDPHIREMGTVQNWAGVYPLFHWGFIPWSFYLVLAVSFGFMLHVRKCRRRRYSEACRPLIGGRTDGICGRGIDLLAVFSLLAGTATTFGVATPLISEFIIQITGVHADRLAVNEVILILTFITYTSVLLKKAKGISRLADICVHLFMILLVYVLLFSGQTRYILETGFQSFGTMIQNFPELATFTDPLRKTAFPQNWTIYYWAYWMVWCVAAPFFIGSISRGRTVRQTILGGYAFGGGATLLSFIILGNYSMGLQMSGAADFIGQFKKSGDIYGVIVSIVRTLPCPELVMLLVVVTMIAFYATSFDSIAYTASCYSYRKLDDGQEPSMLIQFMWCVLLIVFPVALLFSRSSMANLQSISIITAFPLSFILAAIVVSFLKDAGNFLKKRSDS